jgi:hypothetical protein
MLGGYWSTYWYNGSIYGAEIARGLDIFRLKPSEFVSQNELDAAIQWRPNEFNAQQQQKVVWPATTQVAMAYVDQLTRSKAIAADRTKAVAAALGKADGIRNKSDSKAAATITELESLAMQLNGDARALSGRDAKRLASLAETLHGRAARLK